MYRLLFFFVFIISAFSSRAGLDTSSFHHFNLKNGLPSNNVYSLLRDKDGYTWFATDNGLVKYNGYTFEIFNTDNGGLPANDVFDMHEDNRGRIWLRTFSYDFGFIENGKFKKLNYYNSVDRISTPQYITDHKGLVFFSELLPAGYKIIVVDDDVIKVFPLPIERLQSQGIDSIFNITLGTDLDIKIWSADNRLYEWDVSGREPLKYLGKYPEEFRYVYVHRVIVSPSGKYYLFKPGANELYFFDPKTMEYKHKLLSDWGADVSEKMVTISPDFYRNNFIEHTAIITNTHTYTFSPNLELLARQKNSDIIPSMLQLAYRMKDNTGDYWYCTNGDGVWMKPAGYNFYSDRQKNDVLDKSKYVGTIGDISLWWDNVKSELYEVKQRKISRKIQFDKGVDVKSASGNDTAIYLSTSNGIYRYDKRSGSIFDIANNYEVSDFMFGFTDRNNKDKSNKLLLRSFRKIQVIGNTIYGLNSIGLIKMAFEGDKIIPRKYDRERFADCFYDEKNKTFYAYSNQKVLVNSLDSDTSKIIGRDALKNLGIGNIKHLEKDSFGNVWILDDNSLFIYNEHTGRVKRIETNFSFSDCAFRIMGNKLFVAGKFGIGYATIEGVGQNSSFSIVPNSGMVHYARVKDFVVSKDGYAVLNNDVEWASFSLDSLMKYAITIDDHDNFFSIATLNPYKKAIHSNDTLKIGQAETILKLDAINYYGKGTVKYVYRVSGSTKWETSTSGEVFLTTLRAGNYHKIECRVKDDLWESNVYTFYVYRYPMWWQTNTWKTIFWISGVLLFIGLVVLTMLITKYYVAKKNERKRALTELELKAIHSQINPHFIFNTLSAALFYINKKRFDDAYAHVNKFSHLLRSYLKSSQDRYVMLEEEIKMLRNYIELQQIRFEEKFAYKIEIDNKLPTSNIRIPSLLLQPLVENAINHGLFHKEKGGILLLKFEQGSDSSELVCTIEDNGVGRDTARKINEANSTKESYGTKLTNQLLEVFKLYENLDIKLKYIDKALPETGTIVTLVLKNVKYVT